jgi:hypothetical protein
MVRSDGLPMNDEDLSIPEIEAAIAALKISELPYDQLIERIRLLNRAALAILPTYQPLNPSDPV